MGRDGFYRPSAWEVATGWVGGFEPVAPLGSPARPARRAFEDAVLQALQRPPCVVAFSGGRDSSAVLCVATNLARREGLPEPVAVTWDFAGTGAADEAHWQQMVVEHLGLASWERERDVLSFDILSDRAKEALVRYGVLWPPRASGYSVFAPYARGGSLVVGEGGDEVLGPHRLTVANYLMQARRRPTRGMLSVMASDLAPRAVRRSLVARARPRWPWLGRDVADAFAFQQAQDLTSAPLRWDKAVVRHLGRRSAKYATLNLSRLLSDRWDVHYCEPFLDPQFVGAWAAEGGPRGFISRTGMMRHLFADVVPDAICARDQKAEFSAVAVSEGSREFVARWRGDGLEGLAVDAEALRQACLAGSPPFAAHLLLQTAWLATEGTEPVLRAQALGTTSSSMKPNAEA